MNQEIDRVTWCYERLVDIGKFLHGMIGLHWSCYWKHKMFFGEMNWWFSRTFNSGVNLFYFKNLTREYMLTTTGLMKREYEISLCESHAVKNAYCGIIFVRGGPMFMDFVGNPYPRIYIPMNMFLFLLIQSLLILSRLDYSLVIHVITSTRTSKILVSTKHWPPQIKIIPEKITRFKWCLEKVQNQSFIQSSRGNRQVILTDIRNHILLAVTIFHDPSLKFWFAASNFHDRDFFITMWLYDISGSQNFLARE
jgi:hypothetical protein